MVAPREMNAMRSRAPLLALTVALLSVPAPALANTYSVVIDNTKDWAQAQAAAVLAGGYLATITSAAEQAAVVAAIAAASPPGDGGFWLGLEEVGECCYRWTSGESRCYSRFFAAEPNNGGPGEDRGQMIWSSDLARRGTWNDVPAAGYGGALDISRLGYVIEFGPLDPAGPCGNCLSVSPTSACNTPPTGATVVTTRFVGVSGGPGSVGRTITDISEPPPGPGKDDEVGIQSTYLVSLPIAGAGLSAGTIAAAFIDSINRQVGADGFVANYVNASDSTLLQMYRPTGKFSTTTTNTVPGLGVNPASVPIAAWPATAGLALALAGLAGRALRARHRADT
jgi:hypothetical protein